MGKKWGMVMRSMWKGSISFGLVNIPVSLYKATEDHTTSFRSLHEECRNPIQYKKWCPVCNREIANNEIIRGYEYAPGNYIVLTDDDLEKLPLPTLRAIEILHFTNKDDIDPIFFEKSYYIGPGEFGAKPYKLLHDAMEATGKVAVAKVAFRTSEHLAVVRIHNRGLVLNMIHYPDEVRKLEGVPGITEIDHIAVNEDELEMAKTLIEQISGAFRNDYKSNYQEALKALINAKIENVEIESPVTPRSNNVIDLMDSLKRSIERMRSQADTSEKAIEATGTDVGTAIDPTHATLEKPKRRRRRKINEE
ncbi:non-homologous end joining protein Ku [Collibacillus ludicampi]|uniref:Non-homologous end joining protein Ku n=2 Tax=Collibacillus ludicampi TaxID=2771369 RepID=A0AAV4LC45_9BACL|nr:non-homologous end joining protein Ku [Collibacillus ludicampi]